MEGFFKKGYPHGRGVLYRGDGRVLWDGLFWNGAAAAAPDGRAAIPAELEAVFAHFHLNPLRLNYSYEEEKEEEEEEVEVGGGGGEVQDH